MIVEITRKFYPISLFNPISLCCFVYFFSNIQTQFSKEDMRCMVIHPDLTFIACSGTTDTKIYFYDVKSKQRQQKNRKIKLETAPTNKADTKKIIANADKTLKTIEGGRFANYDMNMSPDNNFLSIGAFNKDIRLWQLKYKKPGKRDIIQEYTFDEAKLLCSLSDIHDKPITGVTFSCDSKYMISSSKDGSVKIFEITDIDYERGNKPILLFEQDLKIGAIEHLLMSYQYDIIAVLDDKQQKIYIYRIKYEKKKIKLHYTFDNLFTSQNAKDGKVNCIKFSPDSQYIAIGTTEDCDIRVYKIPVHKNKSSK